jgi:hypothetical protein
MPDFEPKILAFSCNWYSSVFFFGLFSPLADPRKENCGQSEITLSLEKLSFFHGHVSKRNSDRPARKKGVL